MSPDIYQELVNRYSEALNNYGEIEILYDIEPERVYHKKAKVPKPKRASYRVCKGCNTKVNRVY